MSLEGQKEVMPDNLFGCQTILGLFCEHSLQKRPHIGRHGWVVPELKVDLALVVVTQDLD